LQKPANESILRAILHSLPNAVLALDESDNILLANNGAVKLLKTKRDHLEGGSIYRYLLPNENFASNPSSINFNTTNGNISLSCISKEILVEDDSIRVILLKKQTNASSSLLQSLKDFSNDKSDPYQKLCNILIEEKIASLCQVITISKNNKEVVATSQSDVNEKDILFSTPTIDMTISEEENLKIQLNIIPSTNHGLNKDDLELIDLFISLIHLKVHSEETSSDASGSEAALALALKSGSMGLCFFDTQTRDCYLSEKLALWCGINQDTFDGKLNTWINTFSELDSARVSELFSKLSEQKRFKTIVNLSTLEENEKRLEISGRPINEKDTHQWVAIVKEYRDENEVEAAWQTRIAMEESTRIEAEHSLEEFENILHDTLLPTSSDVSIVHSRQDAGTFHIVRPINEKSSIYGVGAITTNSRSQAVVGAAIVATIADVLASKTDNVQEYVKLVRDHARARDIETTMAGVLVSNNTIHAASIGGASVYISGKPFSGTLKISDNTAITISSHSEASPDSVEVAANGRPWKILTSVVEVLSHIDTTRENSNVISLDDEYFGAYKSPLTISQAVPNDDSNEEDEKTAATKDENVRTFRSGSISPS
jgi:hypothetical protein